MADQIANIDNEMLIQYTLVEVLSFIKDCHEIILLPFEFQTDLNHPNRMGSHLWLVSQLTISPMSLKLTTPQSVLFISGQQHTKSVLFSFHTFSSPPPTPHPLQNITSNFKKKKKKIKAALSTHLFPDFFYENSSDLFNTS